MALSAFSKREKFIFGALFTILLVSTIAMLNNINQSFTTNVPVGGGSFSEGVLGTPRFTNPILATSDADKDVVALVYNGLMRESRDGSLATDLAEDFEISADGLSYTFTLKENLTFHDGELLNVDDVLFTISAIKDPIIKSPHRGNWDGITVEKIDDRTMVFKLREPYASFLENTTLGIMPEHLWQNSPIELNEVNTHPVGSGPYQVNKLSRDSSGVVESYELKAFKEFALGEPFIKKINLKFYQDENSLLGALGSGEVSNISSVSPKNAKGLAGKEYQVKSSVLPRIFGLFFNQNQNQLFTDKEILQAINTAIDKDRIVRQVLEGYGESIDSPVPKNILDPTQESTPEEERPSPEEKIQLARKILEEDGWSIGESDFMEKEFTQNGEETTRTLEFVISTGNAEDLVRTAEFIREDLVKTGIKVEIRTFEIGNLNQSVIRPRNYDALLFGQVVNGEQDLFAFWHSSQRKDPGLNIAMYTNTTVDDILEEAFTTLDEKEREEKYTRFVEEIQDDTSAVFLYSPEFIYVISNDIKNASINNITLPSERFSEIHLWYIRTDNIWKIFSK